MAWGFVQNSSSDEAQSITSGTLTTLLTATPAAGNLVFLSIYNITNQHIPTSVMDGSGNALTLLNSEAQGSNLSVSHWAYIVPASPGTNQTKFTITYTGATFDATAYEISGGPSTIQPNDNIYGVTGTSAASGTTSATGTYSFTVGGTLTVTGTETAGAYTGTYNATVTYN